MLKYEVSWMKHPAFCIKWWHPLAVLIAIAAYILIPKDLFLPMNAGTSAPILIIDAGHGGKDGGAVAANGTLESDINLDIALRLEALARFWGRETVMTRSGDDIEYPLEATTIAAKKKADQNTRLELINSTPGAILLSIHQNSYPAAAPNGIQVFFGAESGSDELADILQKNLTAQLLPENRRVASKADSGVYLIRKARCRSVLVECGFVSNPDDLQKLESESYRTKLAVVMLASYLQYTKGNLL